MPRSGWVHWCECGGHGETHLQNSVRKCGRPFSVGLAARILGDQIALYGILPRAIDVSALFIGVKKSRFFNSTLYCKAVLPFRPLRYQFHQLIGRQH
jgi:hypothetical protein